MATEPKQRFYAARGTDGVDPGRSYQIPEPYGTGNIDDYVAQGWDPKDAEEYCKAYFDTSATPPVALPAHPGRRALLVGARYPALRVLDGPGGDRGRGARQRRRRFGRGDRRSGPDLQMESYRTSLGIE